MDRTMTTLSPAESRLVTEMIKPECQIQVVIPEEIKAEKWQEAFTATVKALDLTFSKTRALQPVLGRLLQVARVKPETYKSIGYETFDDFLERAIRSKFAWGRSTCFDVMRMVDRWPGLTQQEYVDIGVVKFNVMAKVIPKGDENKKVAKQILEVAKTSSVAELKEFCVKKGLSENGDHDSTIFSITCSRAQAEEFEKFFDDQEVQAYCESGARASILECAIAESVIEWKNKALVGQNGNGHARDNVADAL